jgi:DNA invertase Pin-like site-specific DNA recombinase
LDNKPSGLNPAESAREGRTLPHTPVYAHIRDGENLTKNGAGKASFIYLRTSTEDQDPENQLADILKIAPEGSEVLPEYGSAWKDELKHRPRFAELLDSIKKGRVSSVNVWDLDRIYRNRIKTVEFMQFCQAHGVVVRSYRQQWMHQFEDMEVPAGMGWMVEMIRNNLIQTLAWVAEEESSKKSHRVKAAYHRKKERGKADDWGRPTAKFNEYRAYQLLFKEGMSIRGVAQELGVSKDTIARRKKEWEKTPPSFIYSEDGDK